MTESARHTGTPRRLLSLSVAALLLAALVAPLTIQAAPQAPGAAEQAGSARGQDAWQRVKGKPAKTHDGRPAALKLDKLATWTLNKGQLARLLRSAPRESSKAAQDRPLVVDLPTPTGGFQRFELASSPVMEAGLAARHPDIETFRGRGVDDPTATIRADITPLGFHASVRSATGSWYIDPYYHLDQSLYASYFGRDLKDTAGAPFVERDAEAAELSVDRGYYHAVDTVELQGHGFAPDAEVTIIISDPEEGFATRTLSVRADDHGGFEKSFVADPDGNLDTHIVEATDGDAWASTSYQVVRDDDPTTDPPTGDVLREYRLALITDPGYATFHGGSANVTPAKVTLMNRVTQIYEDDLSIRMVLVSNNDLLNFDTWDAAIDPNGPCGAAGCFTQAQVTGCSNLGRIRIVIGQVIGASNYDIGHLALGQPGGGVANLGVVGRQNKAGGCTGIPTPTGDFYAVDYVAHEMGHQFSGNHPFNGNQLNCSGGNRSGATSVEPGSGSSIMAYAGICATDDLQPHSDPYFSQRSLQEISTYTSSTQAAINESHTVSLRHFGGGNETQVVTFGPGYGPTSTIQPLTVAIGAAPSATQLGGLDQTGTTVTVSTGAAGPTHTLQPGDSITISGAGNPGYNGTWTVDTVLTSRAFTYTNPTTGLPRTGGGTIRLNAPGLSQVGNTATVRTVAAHNRSVGDIVVIPGGAYAGTWTITAVPSARSFTFEHTSAGLAEAGGGTIAYSSPFQVRIGGSDSAVIGGASQAYNNANIQAAINAIPGFAGTVTVTGAASTGFTVSYGGASAGLDVPSIELVNLSCGGCFASVEETNHGGAFDSFTLNYNGNVSAPIVNGTSYNAAGLNAALASILPAGGTASLAAFGGGNITGLNNQGFQVTFGGTLALTNLGVLLTAQDFTPGASGFTGETDKGGAVDNRGGTVTPTGNTWPAVSAPAGYTIPLRTPFALTGSATDAEDDAMTYIWEQNDRGGTAGTSLLNNVKANGPLFAMFPVSGQISATDTLLYNSPGENHIGSDPTRVFPAMYKILANNTNAETGACPVGPIAYPVPNDTRECFMEFLPTSDYVGFAGVNASPASLHFRFTARDGQGGVSAAAPDTTLILAANAGPFLVDGPGGGAEWTAGSTRTVDWDVANTDIAPVSAANVKISLSLDGGWTYPVVLAESTANDGTEDITVPNVVSETARLKVEAVGNVFFDISNADFTVSMPGVIGLDSVLLGGKGTLIDSFDSDAGAYGPANRTSTVDLFSNGGVAVGAARVAGDIRSATGGVTIDKDGRVTGDVRAGTTIVNLGTIGGTATPDSPSPTIAAPAVAACSPFSGSGGLSGRFTYSPATGNLTVGGGRTVTLANGSYCFNNVTLSGGSTLAVGGPVTISIRGVLNASGGSFLNRTLVPANLQVASSYAGVDGVSVSGGSSGAYLSLYAPQTNVTLSGSGAIYGAVLGKSLAVSGGAAIHYDVQLVTVWADYFNP